MSSQNQIEIYEKGYKIASNLFEKACELDKFSRMITRFTIKFNDELTPNQVAQMNARIQAFTQTIQANSIEAAPFDFDIDSFQSTRKTFQQLLHIFCNDADTNNLKEIIHHYFYNANSYCGLLVVAFECIKYDFASSQNQKKSSEDMREMVLSDANGFFTAFNKVCKKDTTAKRVFNLERNGLQACIDV